MVRNLTFGAALAIAYANPAMAREPLQLGATSDWRLYRDEDDCRLVRAFGIGPDQVILMLHQSGPQTAFNMSAIGKPMANAFGTRMSVVLSPGGAEKWRGYISSKRGAARPFVYLHGINLAPTGEQRAPTSITFSKALSGPVTLETGPLAEQLPKLSACAAELSKALSLESPEYTGFQRPVPSSNPGNWLTSADYPSKALNNDVEGIVRFRLTVDKSGKATSCHIEGNEEPDLFEDQVCFALLRRARFEPARDPKGQPIAAYWSSSARFEIVG